MGDIAQPIATPEVGRLTFIVEIREGRTREVKQLA